MLSVDPEDENEHWKQELSAVIEEIVDRKRSSVQGRESTLAAYIHYLMRRYAHDEIVKKLGELIPALLKSVKGEDSEKETCLALKGQCCLEFGFIRRSS
jgi:hypothetical protein